MLLVSLSNIIVSMTIYWRLQGKKLNSRMLWARDIAFFYTIGMMFVIIFSIGLFVLVTPI
mgnify:CR=1 FL=1